MRVGQGILMLIEIGFFGAFIDLSNLYLTIPMYLLVLIGFGVQSLLLKCCRAGWRRWTFAAALLAGAAAGEIACAVITGWDLLGVLILYGFVLCLAIGALAAVARHWIKARRAGRD